MTEVKVLREKVESFYKEMMHLLELAEDEILTDDQVDGILDILRKEGIWTSKQDNTLERLISGGNSKGVGLRILITGNNKAETLIRKYLSPPEKKIRKVRTKVEK